MVRLRGWVEGGSAGTRSWILPGLGCIGAEAEGLVYANIVNLLLFVETVEFVPCALTLVTSRQGYISAAPLGCARLGCPQHRIS